MSTFPLVRNGSRSSNVAALLGILESRDILYVVIGSVAAAVYGVELQAADLDIVPETDTANLRSLVDALREMEAKPLGPFGNWTVVESGEKKWISRPTAERALAEWMPDDRESLDSRSSVCDTVWELRCCSRDWGDVRHPAGPSLPGIL